jgi:Arc/MetJ family transcription regulator
MRTAIRRDDRPIAAVTKAAALPTGRAAAMARLPLLRA